MSSRNSPSASSPAALPRSRRCRRSRSGHSRPPRSRNNSWPTTPPRCSPRARRKRPDSAALAGVHSIADHHQPVGARFSAPGFARPTQHLPDVRVFLVAGKRGEGLGLGIETLHGVGGPIRRPYPILVVDIDRVRAPLALRHRIDGPGLRGGIVAADRAGVPEAHPKHALGIRPDAARPDTLARRIDDGGFSACGVDAGDVIARSDAYQTSPPGLPVIPYGPAPLGALRTSTLPVAGSARP